MQANRSATRQTQAHVRCMCAAGPAIPRSLDASLQQDVDTHQTPR
jgi:hypothetical protein